MGSRSNEVEQIRQPMAQIRRKHHEDVRELIAGAEVVVRWGRNLVLYAGAVLGATALAAIWLAARTRRIRPEPRISVTAVEVPPADTDGAVAQPDRPAPPASWIGSAANFLLSVAVRAAQSYAAFQVEQWIVGQRQSLAACLAPSQTGDEASPSSRRNEARTDGRSSARVPIETNDRSFPE